MRQRRGLRIKQDNGELEMENREKCGNCVWHIPGKDDWICSCEDSEAYGLETEYTDVCEEFHDIEN